jgi:hypothetical protein
MRSPDRRGSNLWGSNRLGSNLWGSKHRCPHASRRAPRDLVAAGLGLALTLVAAACSKPAEPSAEGPRAATSSSASEAPATKEARFELEWTAPEGLVEKKMRSPMRKATYAVPRAEGDPEDGDLSVSTAGGTVSMNVDRWVKQFTSDVAGEPVASKRSERTVNGLTVTIVELAGTYHPMAMGPQKPGEGGAEKRGSMLLGAVVSPPPGRRGELWFFKLTGPKKTVEGARARFDALVDSVKVR